RYYYDADYGTGGEAAFQRSNRCYERALALDPNLMLAAGQQITNRVMRSEVGKAYEAARALVKRRPESSQAHFALAYVYRYAGMLEQSAKECDAALSLDPGNYLFRSCAWAFMELGNTHRALDFIQIDAGSEWANYVTPSLLLREGRIAEARAAVKTMPTNPRYHRDLLQACLDGSASELDRLARDAVTNGPSEADPEVAYYQGAIFAYCGKKDAAFRMLRTAIETNYCSYSNLLSDPLCPLWLSLRSESRKNLGSHSREAQSYSHDQDRSCWRILSSSFVGVLFRDVLVLAGPKSDPGLTEPLPAAPPGHRRPRAEARVASIANHGPANAGCGASRR